MLLNKKAAAAVLVLLMICFSACRIPPALTEPPSPAPTGPAESMLPGLLPDETAVPSPSPENGRTVSASLCYVTDEGYLLPVVQRIPWEDGIAKACLARLTGSPELDNELAKQGLSAPIPAGTKVQLAIKDGEATVRLSALPGLSNARSEQNLFTAIVNTLTAFPSVNTVSITVDGVSGRTANGVSLPVRQGRLALNAEDGTVQVSGSAKPLTLYFPNAMGSHFIPVTRYSDNDGLYAAISGLARGTELSGLIGCFPENTLVLGAAIENGLLTVNLSEDFKKVAETPGLYSLAMQGVLLTAMKYGSVDEVLFTVNGVPFEP